jgi:hypothetical protein
MYCFYLQGQRATKSSPCCSLLLCCFFLAWHTLHTRKTAAGHSSENSVNLYQTTRSHIPDGSTRYMHCSQKIKSVLYGPPIQKLPGALPLVLKRPGREADHSPPSRAEVKKIWSYKSTHPYAFMALCTGTIIPFYLCCMSRLNLYIEVLVVKAHWEFNRKCLPLLSVIGLSKPFCFPCLCKDRTSCRGRLLINAICETRSLTASSVGM